MYLSKTLFVSRMGYYDITRIFGILFHDPSPGVSLSFSPDSRTPFELSTKSFNEHHQRIQTFPSRPLLSSNFTFHFTKMGNKNKSVGPPTVAQRIEAQATAHARAAAAAALPPKPRVIPVARCEDPSCPITHWHGAREYKADDKYTLKYIQVKEEALKHRLDSKLPIYHDDKDILNRWYAVHDKSRLSCDTVDCPLHDFHLAKEFKTDATDTPQYVKVKEERIKDRLDRELSIVDDDKIFINQWYEVHDTSRHLDVVSIPRPVKCTKDCGLKGYHLDQVYEEGADDLPKTIKEFSARVDAVVEQNIDGCWYEYKILCQFFDVHGPKAEDTTSGSSTVGKGAVAKR